MGEPAPAVASDVSDLLALRDAAALWMQDSGILQWVPGEITRETVAGQVARDEWWVIRNAGGVAGALRLLWSDPGFWGERPDDAVYIHGLVIGRERVGAGVGRCLLDWVRLQSLNAGRRHVRLDCVESNRRLRDYYAGAGFREVGRREFRNGWHPVVLLERSVETV